MAISAVRDALEDMASSAIDAGEELVVTVESENKLAITLRSPRNLKSKELDGLSEAIRDVVSDCLQPDDEVLITSFEVVEVPKPTSPTL
jgi:hypothetical protein